MSAALLGICPTCFRDLPNEVYDAMGLRNGSLLNRMLPRLIGPSDIDHVLHNEYPSDGGTPRVMFYEYKRGNTLSEVHARLPLGQRRMLEALQGDWLDVCDGRRLRVAYTVLPQHPDADALQALTDSVCQMQFKSETPLNAEARLQRVTRAEQRRGERSLPRITVSNGVLFA